MGALNCCTAAEEHRAEEAAVTLVALSDKGAGFSPPDIAISTGSGALPEFPEPTKMPTQAPPKEAAGHRIVEPLVFDMDVDVTGRKLGIDINGMDGKTLLVTKVDEGPIAEKNRAVGGGNDLLLAGDVMVEVNGCSGDSGELIKAMQREPRLRASIRRCRETVIKLAAKDDLPLGLDTLPNDVFSLCLASDAPEGTLVHGHNEEYEDFALRRGDVIVKVNGHRGDPNLLKDELQKSDSWEIVFRRLDKRRTSYIGGNMHAA